VLAWRIDWSHWTDWTDRSDRVGLDALVREGRHARRRGGHPRNAGLAAVLALALAAAAPASAGELAAQGPCAEPDQRAVSPDPEPGYAVAGPPGARFDAADVAAPPLAASVPAPPAPRFPGVGPCERGASACGEAALRRPQGASFPPVGPPPLP